MSGPHRSAKPEADSNAYPNQWAPIGTQAEGMDAIRAVWERAADTDRRREPKRAPAPPKPPRRAAVALPGILAVALLMLFFAWVSAPALWMTLGHSQTGTVTVAECGDGFAPSCTGEFQGGGYTFEDLRLTGEVGPADIGDDLAAQVTGVGAASAYVGGDLGLLLRWVPSLTLFTVCAFALVWISGARRIFDQRGAATALCWTAAVGVLASTMAFAW